MDEWLEDYLDDDQGDPEDFNLADWFHHKYNWLCRTKK